MEQPAVAYTPARFAGMPAAMRRSVGRRHGGTKYRKRGESTTQQFEGFQWFQRFQGFQRFAEMSDVVIVLSTVPDDASAETIARTLVDERLVACVNLLPAMMSIYRWKGAIERETERQLVMKTTPARVPVLEKRLKELHSYDVPEFIVVTADSVSADYLAWLTAEVREQI